MTTMATTTTKRTKSSLRLPARTVQPVWSAARRRRVPEVMICCSAMAMGAKMAATCGATRPVCRKCRGAIGSAAAASRLAAMQQPPRKVTIAIHRCVQHAHATDPLAAQLTVPARPSRRLSRSTVWAGTAAARAVTPARLSALKVSPEEMARLRQFEALVGQGDEASKQKLHLRHADAYTARLITFEPERGAAADRRKREMQSRINELVQ